MPLPPHPRLLMMLALFVGLLQGCRPSNPDVVRQQGPEGSDARGPAASTGDGQAPTRPDAGSAVVFLGTSLTAGLGLAHPDQAYPGLIQERIDREGLGFRVVNAGVSGDTSAGGVRRLAWVLDQDLDVLVLELGANDGLRGLPVDDLRSNLERIVERTQKRHPEAEIVLVGMEAPPNLGSVYTEAFRRVYLTVAGEYGLPLVPFLLDGVGGVPELNQADGIHPTARGHRVLADNVWAVLEPVLSSHAASPSESQ